MTLIVLCLLVAALIIIYVARSRRRQFAYAVDADYRYETLPKSAVAQLHKGRLNLPDTVSAGDTVIAKIKVKSTWVGRLMMPFIRVKSAKGEWKHYLEFGAQGVRYLNVSDTFTAGETLELGGRYVALPDQEVELSCYPREDLSGKKVLVLAPHADDAELSAYGLYEQQADKSLIVTLTVSEAGSFHYANLYNPNDDADRRAQYMQKARMRVWNSLTVPLLAGVPSENILQLGFFDSTLAAMKQNPQAEIKSTKLDTADVGYFRAANKSPLAAGLSGGSTWRGLVDNLAYLLETFRPDIIVMPSPNIDAHADHQHTALAALEAIRQVDYRQGELFLHTLHFLSDDFPIGKRGSMLSLPPKSNQPFYFQSVYSLPLSCETQNRKLLALDAMNDVRPNSDGYLSWYRMLFTGFNRLRHAILHIDKDLINRFVRSNELFYVVAVKDLHDEEIYRQVSHQG